MLKKCEHACPRCNKLLSRTVYISTNLFSSKTSFISIHNLQPVPSTSLFFLKSHQRFFLSMGKKLYNLHPFVQIPLMQAMEEVCDQTNAVSVLGGIHSQGFNYPFLPMTIKPAKARDDERCGGVVCCLSIVWSFLLFLLLQLQQMK